MKTLLATGYKPFMGLTVNPSWQDISSLPDEIDGVRIIKRELPVDWYVARDTLAALIAAYKPEGVLCAGLGGGPAMRIERIGVNLCNGKDNQDISLKDAPVYEDGDVAYFSNFPYDAIKTALEKEGIPARFSFSAGTYLCNHALYTALYQEARHFPGMKCGFIHVPATPELMQEGEDIMELETQQKAMRIIAEEIIKSF